MPIKKRELARALVAQMHNNRIALNLFEPRVRRVIYIWLTGHHHLLNRNIKLFCKSIIALVVRGHGHNGTRAVAPQNIVGHIDRYLLLIGRVNCLNTSEFYTCFFAALCRALYLGLVFCHFHIWKYFRFVVCNRTFKLLHQRMFWGKHHVGCAIQRVCTCGKYFYFLLRACDSKLNLCTLGAAYPIALCLLNMLGPLQRIQVGQHTVGIRSNL